MQSPSGSNDDRLKAGKTVVSYTVREESAAAQDAHSYLGESVVSESTQMEFLLADQDTSADTIPSWRSRLPKSWTLAAQWRQDVQRRRLQLLDELNRLNLDLLTL